jgi:predicted transcriptional regulator
MDQHSFSIRVPQDMADELRARADQQYRSVNSLVVQLLASALTQERAQEAKRPQGSASAGSSARARRVSP